MNLKNVLKTLVVFILITLNISCGGSDGDDTNDPPPVASNICDGVDITTGFWNNGSGDRLFISGDFNWVFRESGVDISSGTWTSSCPNVRALNFEGTVLVDTGNSLEDDPVSCSGIVTMGDPQMAQSDTLSLTCSEGHIDPNFTPDTWFHEN